MNKETRMENEGQTKEGVSTPKDVRTAPKPISPEQVDSLILAFVEEKKRSAEYLNQLKYLQADFENYRKRVDRQMDEVKRTSNERLVMDLLEVIDELELAVRNGKAPDQSALTEGVEMTLKKLRKVLDSEGVKPIESLGRKFDPEVHSVMATTPRNDVENSTVLEELRKGYTMNGRVIRPAMVRISVSPDAAKIVMDKSNLEEEKKNE